MFFTGFPALAESILNFDGMDNLVEYALGGNPVNADAAAVLPVFQALENYLSLIGSRLNIQY